MNFKPRIHAQKQTETRRCTHNYRECPTKIAARAHINLTEHYWVLMSAGVEVFQVAKHYWVWTSAAAKVIWVEELCSVQIVCVWKCYFWQRYKVTAAAVKTRAQKNKPIRSRMRKYLAKRMHSPYQDKRDRLHSVPQINNRSYLASNRIRRGVHLTNDTCRIRKSKPEAMSKCIHVQKSIGPRNQQQLRFVGFDRSAELR